MTPELQDRVINRLIDTGAADKPWAFALLAALEGAAELNAYLDNTLKMTMPQLSERATSGGVRLEPPGVYVSSITVEGFRGVGKVGKLWKFKISEVDEWVRRGAASQATSQTDGQATNRSQH